MKKICFVTTIPLTMKVFVIKTAQYLHENADFDISFICDTDEAFAKELPEYIHYFPIDMKRGISLSGINAMLKIKRIFKREKFDLVQYSTPNASLYASMAAHSAKIPVRLYCQWGLPYVGFSHLKRWIFKHEEKYVCKLSTWIEPDSKSNLNFCHNEGLYPADKGSVIWNGSACGLDVSKFDISKKKEYREAIREKHHIPKNAYVFGFVGRITRDKGVNELLQAYRQLQKDHPDTYLMMIGPGEIDETIEKDNYEWSISSSHVVYTGFTSVVEQYLSALDCFVLPSYREGFGMCVIEAEAMAVPVIVTNIPGPIDGIISGETGIIVPPKDRGALHSAMKSLVVSTQKGTDMGIAGREFVHTHFEQSQFMEHVLEDRLRLLETSDNRKRNV